MSTCSQKMAQSVRKYDQFEKIASVKASGNFYIVHY